MIVILSYCHPPPPPISHPCALYYVLLACNRIFLVVPIPFSFLFHKEVVVFGGKVVNSICKETSPYFCEITLSSFLIHFRKDDSPHCVDFPALFS
jgi:hypothetical protein